MLLSYIQLFLLSKATLWVYREWASEIRSLEEYYDRILRAYEGSRLVYSFLREVRIPKMRGIDPGLLMEALSIVFSGDGAPECPRDAVVSIVYLEDVDSGLLDGCYRHLDDLFWFG